MPNTPLTVLLVDDHSLVRRGFRRLLEEDPGISVVGEASDGHEGVAEAERLQPNVVVMDFALPSMNGARGHPQYSQALPTHRRAGAQHALGRLLTCAPAWKREPRATC